MKLLPCLCLQGALSVLDKSSIIFSLEHWECRITIRPKVICILLLSSFQPSLVCTHVPFLVYSRFCLLLPCTFIFSSHASLLWWNECQTKFTCKDCKDNKLPHALNVSVLFLRRWRQHTGGHSLTHCDRKQNKTHKQTQENDTQTDRKETHFANIYNHTQDAATEVDLSPVSALQCSITAWCSDLNMGSFVLRGSDVYFKPPLLLHSKQTAQTTHKPNAHHNAEAWLKCAIVLKSMLAS